MTRQYYVMLALGLPARRPERRSFSMSIYLSVLLASACRVARVHVLLALLRKETRGLSGNTSPLLLLRPLLRLL